MNQRPSHNVFHIRDRGPNQKGWWTQVGSAWTNKDGSLNVILDTLPIDGKLHIRVPNPKEETPA